MIAMLLLSTLFACENKLDTWQIFSIYRLHTSLAVHFAIAPNQVL